jgi:hypothetical protein
VEAFTRVVDAINRRDVEAVLRELDPGIEWHMALQVLVGGEAGVYHGHEGVREYFRDMASSTLWVLRWRRIALLAVCDASARPVPTRRSARSSSTSPRSAPVPPGAATGPQ